MSDKLIDKWKSTGCFNGLSYFEKNQLAQLLDNQEKYISKPGLLLGMNASTIRSVERMNLPVAARAFHSLAVKVLVSTQVPSNLTTRLIINEDNVKREELISTFTYKTKINWQGYPNGGTSSDFDVEAALIASMGDQVADELSGMVLNDLYSLAHLEMVSNGSPDDLLEAFKRASDCVQRKCGVEPNWIAGNSKLMDGVESVSHGAFGFRAIQKEDLFEYAGHIKIIGKYGRYTFCQVPDASGFIVGYKMEPVESGYFLMPYLLSIPLFDAAESLANNPKGTIACRVGKKVVTGGDFYVRIIVKK